MPEPRIWILPPEVSERIAAGEVVERPASAVKELVENSLDAGARRVTVETEAGGKALIRVTDDGQGMTAEEVTLALQRHATSKLRSVNDLLNIHTLGFRGEALPSIGAVSELEVLTRTPDQSEGTRVLVAGGVVRSVEAAAAQVGTRITVRRLFYNVPVREKFLKSDTTEAAQITEWLQRLALSRPGVSFRLVHDGREAVLSPGSRDPLNAVVSVLGRPLARDLLRLPGGGEQIQVSGFVGRPTLTRANRGQQHFYVNGRSVRSPLFFGALDDAFRSTMPQGRYPVAVLFLDVPAEFVDVNVHPAKVEVRFQDESLVRGAIVRAVAAALRADARSSGGAAPALPEGPDAPEPPPDVPAAEPEIPTGGRVAEPGAPPPGALPFAEAALSRSPAPDYRTRSWPHAKREAEDRQPARCPTPGEPPPDSEDPFLESAAGPRATPAPADPGGEPSIPAATGQPRQPPEFSAPAIGSLALLGQVQDLFLLAEGEDRLWIIDQHVAHERILFDRMTAGGSVREAPQPLLLPPVLPVNRAQGLALEEHRDLLLELGFDVERFGAESFRLRAVPHSLLGENYEAAFRDLVDELTELSRGGQSRLKKEEVAAAAAGRSCKRAVKAGHRLSADEMERLLTELRATRNPYTCPHGRPVFLTFEEDEIARMFGPVSCE